MPSAERILWLITNATSQVLSFVELQHVWNYLSHKPLGMQTILDSAMKVTIQAYIANMTENFSLKALVGLSDVVSYN